MSSTTHATPVSSVILTFRWNTSGLAAGAAQRGQELAREAAAHGATLCAFGPFELTLAFGGGDAQDAASFAARVVAENGELGRAGMALGDISPFDDGDGFVRLAFGAPIVIATALARFAQIGEVVVDAPLSREGLRFTGAAREITLGGRSRSTFLLDIADPIGEATPVAVEATRPIAKETPDGTVKVRESDAPPAVRDLLGLAREALMRSDRISIDAAVAQLNLTNEHADVVERLAGVLAMTRGAKEEGLRVLRKAAEGEEREDKRARAVLAYAIGVAAVGRQDDALLEALTALSIARARGDRSGEKACARFLAQLSFSNGHKDAASAWEHVARGAEPDG